MTGMKQSRSESFSSWKKEKRAPTQGLSARSHKGVHIRTKEKTEMKKNIAIIALAVITAIAFASCDPAIAKTSLIEDETVTTPSLPADDEKSPSIDYTEPGVGDEDTEKTLPPETDEEEEELPSEETPAEEETPEEEEPQEEEPQNPGFWIDEDGVIHISVTEG